MTIESVSTFFTIEKVIACVFFVVFAVYFFIATEKKKRHIWKAILGDDGKMQVAEITILYWVRLFPILFFVNILIVILGLDINQFSLSLMQTAWYALDGVFAFAIVGDAYKSRNIKK